MQRTAWKALPLTGFLSAQLVRSRMGADPLLLRQREGPAIDRILVRIDLHRVNVGNTACMAELVNDSIHSSGFEGAVKTIVVCPRMVNGLDRIAVPASAHLPGIRFVAVHHHQIIVVGMRFHHLVGRNTVVNIESIPIHDEIINGPETRIVVKSPVDTAKHLLDMSYNPFSPAQ